MHLMTKSKLWDMERLFYLHVIFIVIQLSQSMDKYVFLKKSDTSYD